MNYKKIIQIILIIDFLLLTLLGVVSFRFLTDQLRRSQEMDPEILAQYEISLEINQFLDLVKRLKK
mgnify:CR=1 FL=1